MRMVGREEMAEPGPLTLGQYLANWFTMIVGSATVLAEGLLGLRLFFKLGSADSTNGLVKFVYHLSGVAIRPFTDILPPAHELFGGILEPAVLIALVVFAIVSVLSIWVVRSLGSARYVWDRLIPR
ncbi:MAG: hypothetical protein ABR978_05910 [Dehalococcoidia bacterium]